MTKSLDRITRELIMATIKNAWYGINAHLKAVLILSLILGSVTLAMGEEVPAFSAETDPDIIVSANVSEIGRNTFSACSTGAVHTGQFIKTKATQAAEWYESSEGQEFRENAAEQTTEALASAGTFLTNAFLSTKEAVETAIENRSSN
jgi:hypothetical protein